jgi:hypothetical protein
MMPAVLFVVQPLSAMMLAVLFVVQPLSQVQLPAPTA